MAEEKMINGVDVKKLGELAGELRKNPDLAKFTFRATNRWFDCGHSQTTVTDFYGMGKSVPHTQPFVLDADEPPLLLGKDKGANPVEHLLNALVTCLTAALVYHAAIRGIRIEEVESTVEGDIDLRGYTGISKDVKKGYQNITVTFRVKSDASREKLEECARFSPVFNTVTQGVNVRLAFETS
jgi:uncharacterized OsmC-like protein